MSIQPEYAWACVATHGTPRSFIHGGTVRSTRQESQRIIAEVWSKDGEALPKGWKRAYRMGWRCVRVRVDIHGAYLWSNQ